ncbi:MAG: His-Xaa-Ser system protein HxsD [Candidatus Thorarchaeota archaeon]
MKEIIYELEDNKLLLSLKREIYEPEIIYAVAYKFTKKCTIFIEPLDERTLGVYFEYENSANNENIKAIAKNFCNELIEQQLRMTLEKKFGNLREVIVKQAFSPISDVKSYIKISNLEK